MTVHAKVLAGINSLCTWLEEITLLWAELIFVVKTEYAHLAIQANKTQFWGVLVIEIQEPPMVKN